MFDRGERTWQDRLIFDFRPDEISSVDIRRGEEEYTLSRGAGVEWMITAPETMACRQNFATRLVRMLALLRCDGFAGRLPLPGSNVAGSDTTLRFATSGGEEHRLFFGSENDAGQVHLAKDDSDAVYLLARVKVDQLTPSLSEILREEPASGGASE